MEYIYFYKVFFCLLFIGEKVLVSITAYCHETSRIGSFELSDILRVCPRVFRRVSDSGDYIEIGILKSFHQGLLFRNRYSLRVKIENILLDFFQKNQEKNRVYLGLPPNYRFGREVFLENL